MDTFSQTIHFRVINPPLNPKSNIFLGTQLNPASSNETILSPLQKGQENGGYLTQFSCKLDQNDIDETKIAAFKVGQKLNIPLHFIGSNFHRQDFTMVQIISKNLLSQGAISKLSFISGQIDFLSFTAAQDGDSNLIITFLSTRGLSCNIDSLTLDTTSFQYKQVFCQTPNNLSGTFNFRLKEYPTSACSYLNTDSTTSTTISPMPTWKLEITGTLSSGYLFYKAFPTPNVLKTFIVYEFQNPSGSTLNLMEDNVNYSAFNGLSLISLQSYNCGQNCMVCDYNTYPNGRCGTCKPVNLTPLTPF